MQGFVAVILNYFSDCINIYLLENMRIQFIVLFVALSIYFNLFLK